MLAQRWSIPTASLSEHILGTLPCGVSGSESCLSFHHCSGCFPALEHYLLCVLFWYHECRCPLLLSINLHASSLTPPAPADSWKEWGGGMRILNVLIICWGCLALHIEVSKFFFVMRRWDLGRLVELFGHIFFRVWLELRLQKSSQPH